MQVLINLKFRMENGIINRVGYLLWRHSDNGGHYEVLNEDDECWAHIGLHDDHKVNLEYLEGKTKYFWTL